MLHQVHPVLLAELQALVAPQQHQSRLELAVGPEQVQHLEEGLALALVVVDPAEQGARELGELAQGLGGDYAMGDLGVDVGQ